MAKTKKKQNIASALTDIDLQEEMDWISNVIVTRYQLYFLLESDYSDIRQHVPPKLTSLKSPYTLFVKRYNFTFEERVAMALCLLARLRPQSLDIFFTKNKTYSRKFVEFGGSTESTIGSFLPTGATLLFILTGADIPERLGSYSLLRKSHRLFSEHLLELVPTSAGMPRELGMLCLSPETEAELLWKEPYRPEFTNQFPAKLLQTPMVWEDLVLHPKTEAQISEIFAWIKHGQILLEDWDMGKKLRPGFRSLFYGPPGTGKTMTASLLGKEHKRDVYRVDLSMVVSKYIGETEKNLAKVFDMAEYRDWILFFDEADALFGRRTQVQDAHDRYANQEVSYLLQRVESFNGLVILASNMRSNIDEAFTRRFESIINFPMPRSQERFELWNKGFSKKAKEAFSPDVNLQEIAQKYELSGGSIMNVIRYVVLQAIEHDKKISPTELLVGIRREYGKEGKTV